MTMDSSKYPKDWKVISHFIRFDRAKGRCECRGECGTRGGGRACALTDYTLDLKDRSPRARCIARNGKPNPRTGSNVVLTVAHLDDDPMGIDPIRLRAMCQACHLAYDHNLHQSTRKANR